MSEKLSSGQKAFISSQINQKITERIKFIGLDEMEKKVSEINDLHKKMFEGSDEEPSIQGSIEDLKDDFAINLKSIETKKIQIDTFHEKVFGKKNEEGKLIGGLDNKLVDHEKKFIALHTKIEGLLPGATTTGLAKAYQDHKKSFFWPNIIWSGVFIISMCFIIGIAFWSFKEVDTVEKAFLGLLSRFPFFFAAIWLALFASSQQSQMKRLEQEYAHKEALARSFEGYKREIEELGESEEVQEILNKLVANVVEMTGYNPSLTLDKKHEGVKPPLLDKIPFLGKKSE